MDRGKGPEEEMATHSRILDWGESHRQRSMVGYSPWGHRVRHDFTNEHICRRESPEERIMCMVDRTGDLTRNTNAEEHESAVPIRCPVTNHE